ncbi:elongation factor Ts, mitochondrial isoform X1 [Colius striatus]|uniref:elongation factor Ts, mitochondrial isoform X1 n=1 Tax=Colius striatus TaxID=57412 RepID=UPI002B1DE314|nr:elongation factor Ts, mitochondrial isoform X1 [Colius striatus]
MQRAALRAAAAARPVPCRWFRGPVPLLAVTAADKEALLRLRRNTGLPFTQCREALQRCAGDLEQAEAWLQAEAQRRGWSRSGTLRSRRAREGLVGLLRDGAAAVMVEVNCETDFVARTPQFQQLVERVVLGTMAQCRASPPRGDKYLLQEEELGQLRTSPGGELLSDHFALAMGQLGEKLALRRAAWLQVPEATGHIGAYAHGSLAAPGPVAMGTYGALVACEVTEPALPAPQLEALGKKVAQHVVGMAPTTLGSPEDQPQGEHEKRLLAQSFLLAPDMTLGQFLAAQGGLRVRDFLRFQCGHEEEGEGQ